VACIASAARLRRLRRSGETHLFELLERLAKRCDLGQAHLLSLSDGGLASPMPMRRVDAIGKMPVAYSRHHPIGYVKAILDPTFFNAGDQSVLVIQAVNVVRSSRFGLDFVSILVSSSLSP